MKKQALAAIRAGSGISRRHKVPVRLKGGAYFIIAFVLLLQVSLLLFVSCSEPGEPFLTCSGSPGMSAALTTDDYQVLLDIWNAHPHEYSGIDFGDEYKIYPLGEPAGDKRVPFFEFGDNIIFGLENVKDDRGAAYCCITEEERRTLVNMFGAYFGNTVDFDAVFVTPDFGSQGLIRRTFTETPTGTISGASVTRTFTEKQYGEFKKLFEPLADRIVASDNYRGQRLLGMSADYQVCLPYYVNFFDGYYLITLKSRRPAADGYIELTPDEFAEFTALFSEVMKNPS